MSKRKYTPVKLNLAEWRDQKNLNRNTVIVFSYRSRPAETSTSYYDGVAAGAVWENGKRIAQLIRKKIKKES
jgi:hypothetical protein